MEGSHSGNGGDRTWEGGIVAPFLEGYREGMGREEEQDPAMHYVDVDPFEHVSPEELYQGGEVVGGTATGTALAAGAALTVGGGEITRRRALAGIAVVAGSVALASTADAMEIQPVEGVVLASAMDSTKRISVTVTALHPAPRMGDMYYKPTHISFTLGSGRTFDRTDVRRFSPESQPAILDVIPEQILPTGSIEGVALAQGADHPEMDLTFLKVDEEGSRRHLVAVEATPTRICAITATEGRLISSGTGEDQPVGPDGEPIEGVRWLQSQGNGALMIYDKDDNIYMLREGERQAMQIDNGRLERDDHFAAHEMTFVPNVPTQYSGVRFDLGLGHFRVDGGRLIHNHEYRNLPKGVTADPLDVSAITDDPRKVRCIGSLECGQILVVYENADGSTEPVIYATEAQVIAPESEVRGEYEPDYIPELLEEEGSESGFAGAGAHLRLRLVKQGIQLMRGRPGSEKIFPQAIDRVIPGGEGRAIKMLTRSDQNGDAWAMNIGGAVENGKPAKTETLGATGMGIGPERVTRGRNLSVFNADPDTIEKGGDAMVGVCLDGTPFFRVSTAGYSREDQGMFRERMTAFHRDRARAFGGIFAATAITRTARADSNNWGNSDGPMVHVWLRKEAELVRESGDSKEWILASS